MNENEMQANLKVCHEVMTRASGSIQEATMELRRRQARINGLQNTVAQYEQFIGEVYELLKQEEFDKAMDRVTEEYRAIHGPEG